MNGDTELLKEITKEFAEKNIKAIVQNEDEQESFNLSLYKEMANMGFFGMTLSEEYGGLGLDYFSYCSILEELAGISCSYALTVAITNTLGIEPICQLLCGEQNDLLQKIISGDIGATGVLLLNDHQKETYIIGENKLTQLFSFILPDNRLILLYKNDLQTLKPNLIPNKLGIRSVEISRLSIDIHEAGGLMNKNSQLLTTDYTTILSNYNLAIAAIAIGACKGVYDIALKYTKERKICGKPVNSYQANAYKLVDIQMEIYSSEALLKEACRHKHNKKSYLAYMAKVASMKSMKKITDEVIQLLGAYGLTTEYSVERFYRDCRMIDTLTYTIDFEKQLLSEIINC